MKKAGNEPKLRFPEFREAEGWALETGDMLFDQINDRNHQPGLHVLAITQEHGAIPRHMIDYHVSVTEKSVESYKVVREGDFIISLRSFQGGIEYSRYHGICSPAYVILRRRGDGSDEYFRHYLKTERFIRILTKNLEGLRDGKMISYAQFSELLIPTPSPAEQQKIAECLRSVDELIAAQGRKLDALRIHKKGLMQQLFPREGETQPRLRFPEFQNAGEWNPVTFGALGLDVSDGNYSSKYPSQSDFVATGVPFLRANNLRFGTVSDDDMRFISKEQHSQITKGHLKKGDILITTRGELGTVALVPDRHIGSNINAQIVRINTGNKIANTFLFHLLDYSRVIGLFDALSTGTALKQLPIGKLNQLALYIPDVFDEQQRIADCLTSLDDLITAETQKLEALRIHKKGLMQQLFPTPEEPA
jgi:type I restriction enzyme S subunit